jgi:hypothetical protein
MPGGKLLQKVFEPLAKQHVGARVIPVMRLTAVSGS